MPNYPYTSYQDLIRDYIEIRPNTAEYYTAWIFNNDYKELSQLKSSYLEQFSSNSNLKTCNQVVYQTCSKYCTITGISTTNLDTCLQRIPSFLGEELPDTEELPF